jgi:glutamate/tyrosine decarboxylase-like PLP-dependent enzyme
MTPKNAKLTVSAIAGLGSANLLEVDVDDDAHIDIAQLEDKLNDCIKNKIPVYAVVAIIGSTEEGAVDRLEEIVEMRDKMQKKGLSFLIHADAAWGGYFATMLHRGSNGKPKLGDADKGAVPALTLRKETERDLLALHRADSITVDPHKAGYVPYPAGSLVYKDGRMRHLVTWSSPYLSQGSSENIGVYGVEGRCVVLKLPQLMIWPLTTTVVVNLELPPCQHGFLTRPLAWTQMDMESCLVKHLSRVPE